MDDQATPGLRQLKAEVAQMAPAEVAKINQLVNDIISTQFVIDSRAVRSWGCDDAGGGWGAGLWAIGQLEHSLLVLLGRAHGWHFEASNWRGLASAAYPCLLHSR
jgi:hypothetical protein